MRLCPEIQRLAWGVAQFTALTARLTHYCQRAADLIIAFQSQGSQEYNSKNLKSCTPRLYNPTMRSSIPPRHAKLRASCDACGFAKVKCGREENSCSRCASLG